MKRQTDNRRLAREKIRLAFADVRLEDGISLRQARAIDDNADADTIEQVRNEDEAEDWSRIPLAALQKYNDTLHFFDAKGMRFHLPAFMIAMLSGEIGPSIVYPLTHLDDWSKKKFCELSIEQRQAVRAFLLELEKDPAFEWEKLEISDALKSYWKE